MSSAFLRAFAAASTLLLASGCVLKSGTNLGEVAKDAGFDNVTTGDGTYENYTAVSHERATEIGLGLGVFTFKLMELYPATTNEALLLEAANKTKEKGAEAMINVHPQSSYFFGFIIGVYVDSTNGTGIEF
ncbi:MAG: hypothetical protein SF028_02680 [Candidatus Sumerlaeia bacterium]|nr:hypothetical protein [Candidatus Sumerlaeia bacterium]